MGPGAAVRVIHGGVCGNRPAPGWAKQQAVYGEEIPLMDNSCKEPCVPPEQPLMPPRSLLGPLHRYSRLLTTCWTNRELHEKKHKSGIVNPTRGAKPQRANTRRGWTVAVHPATSPSSLTWARGHLPNSPASRRGHVTRPLARGALVDVAGATAVPGQNLPLPVGTSDKGSFMWRSTSPHQPGALTAGVGATATLVPLLWVLERHQFLCRLGCWTGGSGRGSNFTFSAG